METIEAYLQHYLTVQSFLFAVVLESFRDVLMVNVRLDVSDQCPWDRVFSAVSLATRAYAVYHDYTIITACISIQSVT